MKYFKNCHVIKYFTTRLKSSVDSNFWNGSVFYGNISFLYIIVNDINGHKCCTISILLCITGTNHFEHFNLQKFNFFH